MRTKARETVGGLVVDVLCDHCGLIVKRYREAYCLDPPHLWAQHMAFLQLCSAERRENFCPTCRAAKIAERLEIEAWI